MRFSLSTDATLAIHRQADDDRSGLSTPAAPAEHKR
jgi:hypothetical protein